MSRKNWVGETFLRAWMNVGCLLTAKNLMPNAVRSSKGEVDGTKCAMPAYPDGSICGAMGLRIFDSSEEAAQAV